MKIRTLPDKRISRTESVQDIILNFDFYRINRVLSAKLLRAESEALHSIEIEFCYDVCFAVVFRFVGIRQLILPSFCPYAFMSEIEVEDLSLDQLEGINFQFKDCGQSDLCVRCKYIELIAINTLSPE